MGRVALVATALLLTTTAPGELDPTQLAHQTRASLETFRVRLIGRVPEAQGLRVDSVDVIVDPALANFTPPFALRSSTDSEVHISLGYLARLHACIEAMTMESTFKTNPRTRDLRDAYDIHLLGSLAFSGQKRLPLTTFARLSDAEQQSWKSSDLQVKIGSLFDQAAGFAFAHELGHHALDAFYTITDPPDKMRAVERQADDWAVQALIGDGVVPIAGATASITCLTDDDRYSYTPREQSSHLGRAERVLQALAASRSKWQSLYGKPPYNALPLAHYRAMEQGLEGVLQKEADKVRSETRASLEAESGLAGSDSSSVKARVSALLKLARYYEFGWGVAKDLAKRHELLLRAADEGDVWAQYAVAFDQDAGVGTPQSHADAFVTYTWLASAGYKAADASLAGLPSRATAKQLCEGQCRVGAGAASFKSCIEQRQTACVRSCTKHYGLEQELCQHRMCSTMTNYQYWYQTCLPETLPDAAVCRSRCAAPPKTPAPNAAAR